MMQAMIFAAGLGTRLKPLTDHTPKALVKVGGEPLLKHVILRMKGAGFERIVVNVHHFADQIEGYLSAQQNFGMDIRISDERQSLLDTGGGIRHARPLFDPASPILVHNVDILSNVDLRSFYTKAHGDATLLVSQRTTKRYLLFDSDGSCRLKGWTNVETNEVRTPHQGLLPDQCLRYAFSGIHVFSPNLFGIMDEWPERFGIIDFYLKACADRGIYGCVDHDLRLMDVGKMETIDQAEHFLTTLQ